MQRDLLLSSVSQALLVPRVTVAASPKTPTTKVLTQTETSPRWRLSLTHHSCVQIFVHHLLRICELAQSDFGGVFTLADRANHFLLLVMLNLGIDVNPRDFPMQEKENKRLYFLTQGSLASHWLIRHTKMTNPRNVATSVMQSISPQNADNTVMMFWKQH